MENNELNVYYTELMQDVRSEQIAVEDGGFLEQIFTAYAINLLSEAGETENYRLAYSESLIPRNRHKINAYSIADNHETVDLFVTIFNQLDDIQRVSKAEIDNVSKLGISFFKKSRSKNYAGELEESTDIFQFARTLGESEQLKANLVRVNVIILTNGLFKGEIPEDRESFGFPVFYKVVDLNYLFNLTEKEHTPIVIDFLEEGFNVSCIKANTENPAYQSYLAVIPGSALAAIYEKYGARLLEQNVRAFLQFTGKINKGIRSTIMREPHMFLAFNNGIAATANSIVLRTTEEGLLIESIDDLQIVNGGQTTAAIYHTLKKDRSDITKVFVQMKLSVIKDKSNFSGIVSRISEYANTQNKISVSDLSSNTPFHVEVEKLSRNTWAPARGQVLQTRWFYERARGQYKNARLKFGTTKRKLQDFDNRNPRTQFFTKEELAKYINVSQERYFGSKLMTGPHMVVRGSQKNYTQFVVYNLPSHPNLFFFEELIGKAIIFRHAEWIYGIKPNSIGDMRYITVPYTIAWLCYRTNERIDYRKIWKAQNISANLEKVLSIIMRRVEAFIKNNAPGSLYGEWAKKEDCWSAVKVQKFGIDFQEIRTDVISAVEKNRRDKEMAASSEEGLREFEINTISSIKNEQWRKFGTWGKETRLLNARQQAAALDIADNLSETDLELPESLLKVGLRIIEIVSKHEPGLFQ
ncbi:AIPR family protein [Chitinophaga arvensicola]|uniref:AIPR protein n=1 Tax=Chitinophaga arvensicola TaxID=29529 RepID=A0A1I0SAH8_9BACT|nr:AIPR family protein [Chitinophaga arvensicola]SEW53496.1 AIPR protein [Chitinophaga arvensicola]